MRLLKRALIFFIRGYQIFFSPFFGRECRFFPSCSVYAKQAIEEHGMGPGLLLTIRRLSKCHPLYRGDWYDPVPQRERLVTVQEEKNSSNSH